MKRFWWGMWPKIDPKAFETLNLRGAQRPENLPMSMRKKNSFLVSKMATNSKLFCEY